MRYKVWHTKDFVSSFAKEKPQFPEAYDCVATIESESLDDTFRITNHIDEDWTTNPEVVEVHVRSGCRSTSVGDVMEDSEGNLFYCAPIGWEELKGVAI